MRLTVQDWSTLAVRRAELEVCWASVAAVEDSVELERAVLDVLRDEPGTDSAEGPCPGSGWAGATIHP